MELTILGPDTVAGGDTASYTAMVTWSGGTLKDVAWDAEWSVDPPTWCVIAHGELATAEDLSADDSVTLRAEYTENGVTVAGEKEITLTPKAE